MDRKHCFQLVVTVTFLYIYTNYRYSNVEFQGIMTKVRDLDARGVQRLCILRKFPMMCSIAHFSHRAWKYESNGGQFDGVSTILKEKNDENG